MTTVAAISERLARLHSIPVAHVRAVIDVESGGTAFTNVIDRYGRQVRFPLARFEGHLFFRFLSGEKRDRAVRQGLASSKTEVRGGVKNPRSQQGRYDLWQKACDIDVDAATAACSWGVGQVLGSHYRVFGLPNSMAIYDQAASGLEGQVELIFDYCAAFGLIDELQRGDWTAFARGYNGPNYRQNRYDEKLADAADRHGAARPSISTGMLRMGSKGPRVRELQRLLVRAGYPVKADGDFGPATKAAVRAYQTAHELTVDGVVGPQTFSRLEALIDGEREDLALTPILEQPAVQKAAAPVAGATVVVGLKGSIEAAAAQVGQLAGVSSAFETAATGLVAIAGLVGIVAAGWAAWEWIESRRTYEGVRT